MCRADEIGKLRDTLMLSQDFATREKYHDILCEKVSLKLKTKVEDQEIKHFGACVLGGRRLCFLHM